MGHNKDATPNQTLPRQRRVTRHCQTRPWCWTKKQKTPHPKYLKLRGDYRVTYVDESRTSLTLIDVEKHKSVHGDVKLIALSIGPLRGGQERARPICDNLHSSLGSSRPSHQGGLRQHTWSSDHGVSGPKPGKTFDHHASDRPGTLGGHSSTFRPGDFHGILPCISWGRRPC